MRHKTEKLDEIGDAKSFMNAYQLSCSYKILKYIMYIILATVICLIIWSTVAKKDVVTNAYGEIDSSHNVCNIYIQNTCIGNIKESFDVQLEVISLPRNEYGIISTKLNEVSDSASISDSNGNMYYKATCELPTLFFNDKDGTKVVLKNGMKARVSIINYTTTYFNYFLQKMFV